MMKKNEQMKRSSESIGKLGEDASQIEPDRSARGRDDLSTITRARMYKGKAARRR
jgi:hypothetical protein